MGRIDNFIKNNAYYTNQQTGELTGQNFGTNLAEGIAGAAGLAANIGGIANNYRRINLASKPQEWDVYGKPSYNFGQQAADINSFKPKGATGGEILGAAAQGAAAGSAILPGVGTAIGAGVGALGGFVGGLFKKNQMDTDKHRGESLLASMQGNYNQSMKDYNQNYLGRQAYEDQLKMYNLPNSYV